VRSGDGSGENRVRSGDGLANPARKARRHLQLETQ
jgi:hypothetical protein